MKRKFEKSAAAILAVIQIMIVLTGCGNSINQEQQQNLGNQANAEPETEKAEVDEKVHINIYRPSFNLASPDENEVKAVEEAVNAYIADKINVEISLTDIGSGEYSEKANLALANKEINMLWTAYWLPTVGTDDLYRQNVLYDLTDLIDGTELYQSIPAWVWDSAAFDGKTYFVSCYKEGGAGIDLMFRKELVDTYGWDISEITDVTKLSQLEPMLAQAKDAGMKYPFLMQKTGLFWRFYVDKYDSFLGDSLFAVDQDKDEVVAIPWTEEYKEFSTLMCEWAEKGYVSEDEVTKVTGDTTPQGQDWAVSFWVNIPNNDEANKRYGQEVVLQKITQDWSTSTIMIGSCYGVTSYSKEEEAKACVDFLELLYTDSVLADLWTFGIEGTDYIRKDDGSVSKMGDQYNHSAWESGSVLNISLEEGEPSNKIELYEKFNENVKPSCALGFRFDKSGVEAQYSACINLFDQYGYVLECGGYPSEDVEKVLTEYQQELEEAGFQEVLQEAQSQYRAWQALRD